MTMLIVPLFTAGIAVGGIQNAYAGGIIIIIISPPVITAPDDVTAECNEPGGASGVDLGTPTVEDPDNDDLPPTNDAAEPFSLGDTVVTWTVVDASGLSDSDTQTVAVVDTTPPEITVPDGFMAIANTDGGWSGDIGQATATDICDPNVDITNDAPNVFPLGDTVVEWCATDDSGNAFCATQIINVKPLPVDIDIKPNSDPNSINPRSMGLVPVAILGSDTFDVIDVDPASLAFGPGAAEPVHLQEGFLPADHYEDVNDDGLLDLVTHYVQKEALPVEPEACLTGALDNGTLIEGCDSVRTPGNK